MAILYFLSGSTDAAESALPDIGVGNEWEGVLSPVLIVTPKYGTRASTILSVIRIGKVSLLEHSRVADGSVRASVEFHFETHRH